MSLVTFASAVREYVLDTRACEKLDGLPPFVFAERALQPMHSYVPCPQLDAESQCAMMLGQVIQEFVANPPLFLLK